MTVLKQWNTTNSQWETVLVGGPGPQGVTGSQGPTGATGPTGPAGVDGTSPSPVGAKMTALTALTGANLAATDILEVVDISDTTMAASGTNKKLTLAELQVYLKNPAALYNVGIAAQGPGFAADTYVTGSSITVPTGRLQAKTIYRCQIYVSKTGAGTATPIVTLRFGTGGVVGDASLGALTFIAGTAVIDAGVIDITAAFRTVGSGTAAVVQTLGRITHTLSITGITGAASTSPALTAVSSGFDSTVAASVIGVSVNGGSGAVWTVSNVTAELMNLA